MSHITKIAAVENTAAIWEYDPTRDDNRVLGGALDVIAAIRTLAIKVSMYLDLEVHVSCRHAACVDSSVWTTHRIFRKYSDSMWHP